jgi:hypothetical protein
MAGIPGRTTYAWRQIVKRLRATATHCAKCEGELYPDLRFPHPWSTTGGHIIPVDLRPDLADTPSNARAEHLRCNTREGAQMTNRKRKNAAENSSYRSEEW